MIPAEYKKGVQLLVDGKQAFEKIVERIETARRSIRITSFIWRDDSVGNLVGRRLLEAADRGVKVQITKDRLGAVYEKAEENKQSLLHKTSSPGLWLKQMAADRFYDAPQKPKSARQRPSGLAEAMRRHANITIGRHAVRADHSNIK